MRSKSFKNQGFTLTETVIAIGVVALLLTSFIAVFGPARNQIQNTVARERADLLQQSLVNELQTLKPNEAGTYNDAFAKAFEWLQDSHTPQGAIFLYVYRADLAQAPRVDGSLAPMVETATISGQESITEPAVRRVGDVLFENDLPAIEGRLYYVKLTQLVDQNGVLVPGTPGQIIDPETNTAAASAQAFTGSVLTAQADFYLLPTKQAGFIDNAFEPDNFTTPAFSRNLAIRR